MGGEGDEGEGKERGGTRVETASYGGDGEGRRG